MSFNRMMMYSKKSLTLKIFAVSWNVSGSLRSYYYGYNGKHGSVDPKTIMFRGTAYPIAAVFSYRNSFSRAFILRISTAVPFSTIELSYNNAIYTLTKGTSQTEEGVESGFRTDSMLWESAGTYTLKILSIK